MRIAVISDIHGNLPALEAVVHDMSRRSPDIVINLGDHLSGPLWPAETADLLMSRCGWTQIRGNHDRQLVNLSPAAMSQSDAAAFEHLSPAHKRWLSALPSTCIVADNLLLCHGTPESDLEYPLEDVSSGFPRLCGTAVIRLRMGPTSRAILCGHSHMPRFVLRSEQTVAANPDRKS